MMIGRICCLLTGLLIAPAVALAQAGDNGDEAGLNAGTFRGLELRNIGPALMSGRIADIDIHPQDPATWYVAVGSGGVWKTENAGTTWTPLFDSESVYSTGTITIDPSNSDVIWVGSGENVGGRHVGWGNGVYRSRDGGKSWENLGLQESEHISEIIIHPEDANTAWVAAQGPLWSPGGDRGLFKTSDGGETWRNVLSAGEWTGVTDIVIDPRNPDRLYAATWQHHRNVAGYMGGGPESGLYKSEDGGETWRKLETGLPTGNLAKIGLAISPQNPDVVYAAIELNRRTGGIWRSTDRGESWEKRSDTVSGATGPHYYQELYASPHAFDRIYLADVRMRVSDDGGKTFRQMNEENKHSDNHSLAFRPDDPDYLLVGTDGGIYETYDAEKSWRFIDNLPVTQFYKLAVDDSEPFYLVYGGTQDNSTQGGPSRTDNLHGIRNSDWFLTLFADGHQPATEPGNPDIMYSQTQQGGLFRVDRITGGVVSIQPKPAPGEPEERFNWDAPILVSSHDPKRIFHGSQRLWRSDNRGDSWRALSGDLTRNQDRMNMDFMGRTWGWDAPWDLLAMSTFNTITSIAESPLDDNTLVVGTDDGLIQITRDGGQNWDETEVGDLPGVPDNAYVNDIKADLFDVNTFYIALDAHKYGDFTPYLLKSTNGGRSWTSIAGNLPDDHVVWRLVQDHENPDLMFAGTEFGIFFTVDGGERWIELDGGVPTISFRDLAIQRRENDLVAASFGRGFFILDDYTPLRSIDEDALAKDALLFQPKDAHWYIPQHPMGFSEKASQGHGLYTAPNPPFGAVFTYYLSDGLKSLEDIRKAEEKPLIDDGEDIEFPGFEAIDAELEEPEPEIWLTVRDDQGNVVRRIQGPTQKGFHRVAWDLRFPNATSIAETDSFVESFFGGGASGHLAPPGSYTVSLTSRVRGETTDLAGPLSFEVVRLRDGALEGSTPEAIADFAAEVAKAQRSLFTANRTLRTLDEKLEQLRRAIAQTRSASGTLDDAWQNAYEEAKSIARAMSGSPAAQQVGEGQPLTVSGRLAIAGSGYFASTYGPTETHRQQFEFAKAEFAGLRERLNTLVTGTVPALETAIVEAGGPALPGGAIPDFE